MKFSKYNPSKIYAAKNEKVTYAQGVIPKNATVKHINGGSAGTVVNSNESRALVAFGAQSDWYSNSELKVQSDL